MTTDEVRERLAQGEDSRTQFKREPIGIANVEVGIDADGVCSKCLSSRQKQSLEKRTCHVVAGPNGAGKSTFALRYLPDYAGSIEYVNPDLVAQGLSPTDIRLSAIKAGKLTLARIAELIAAGASFGFETTLSGRGHLSLLADARTRGYAIHLYYLWMPAAAMLPVRIRHRVVDGGHDVPSGDVMRRYERSRANLRTYMALSDKVYIFDATRPDFDVVWRRNGVETAFDRRRADALRKGGWL